MTTPHDGQQDWYFTFGFGQENAGRYVKLTGVSSEAARDRMFALFGRRWGFQYDTSQWFRDGVSQAEQYRLTELPVDEMVVG